MQEDDQELHAAAYRRIWERMRDDDPQAKLYVQDLRDLFMVFGMHPPQPGEEPVIPVWVQPEEGPVTVGQALGGLVQGSADDCRHAISALARVGQRLDEVIAAGDKSGSTPFVNARQIRDLMDPEGAWSYSFYGPPPQNEPGGDQTLEDRMPPGSGPPP